LFLHFPMKILNLRMAFLATCQTQNNYVAEPTKQE